MGLESLTNGLHPSSVMQEPISLRNALSKNWIVQKFGGTSVGRFAENIAGRIVRLVHTFAFPEHRRVTEIIQQAKSPPEPRGGGLLCAQ